jgi:hypothetical protein
MKLDITYFHFEELLKKGYSLDVVFLLKLIEENYDVRALRDDNIKIEALYQTLVRKGLITEKGLTLTGKELLKFVNIKEPTVRIQKKVDITSEFEEWWKAFPGTDNFTHKGKKFSGDRTLRKTKEDCQLKFDKILEEGEYTAKDLIDSLNLDVLQKKENSVKTGTNKLTYMQNSLTYLNQRSFEPFIELLKEGYIVEDKAPTNGGTDI